MQPAKPGLSNKAIVYIVLAISIPLSLIFGLALVGSNVQEGVDKKRKEVDAKVVVVQNTPIPKPTPAATVKVQTLVETAKPTVAVTPDKVASQPVMVEKKTTAYSSPSYSSSRSNGYIRGPRGGCYYINRNGNKTYVDRSMCD